MIKLRRALRPIALALGSLAVILLIAFLLSPADLEGSVHREWVTAIDQSGFKELAQSEVALVNEATGRFGERQPPTLGQLVYARVGQSKAAFARVVELAETHERYSEDGHGDVVSIKPLHLSKNQLLLRFARGRFKFEYMVVNKYEVLGTAYALANPSREVAGVVVTPARPFAGH